MGYIYKFNREECWYKKVCNLYAGEVCNPACPRYMEMDFLMNNSGIPKNRQYYKRLIPSKADKESFLELQEIKEDMLNFVKGGESLYLYSEKFGNGKTTWSLKMMTQYFDDIWAGNGFRCRGIFINVPTFLTKIREGIGRRDEDFELLKSRLPDVDLVIWDDIAATKLSDYDYSNLLTYIDQRKLNGLSNIYTGNLSGSELNEAVGNRLASRIWNDGTIIHLTGDDRRGR